MPKFLYFLIAGLFLFLIYTINTQDIRIKDSREYEQKVVIYSKSKCYYCESAKDLLIKKDIAYREIDITWDKELHSKLLSETQQSTVPYIFIQGKFIGGYQDLEKLEQDGQLKSLLEASAN